MADLSSSTNIDYGRMEKHLRSAKNPDALHHAIVNSPFIVPQQAALLFLGITVLLLVNKQEGTIDRVALSDTSHAHATKAVSAKPFEAIKIPLDSAENLISQVVNSQKPSGTADWANLFVPELTAEQAHIIQANAGIGYSAVFPVSGTTKQGALIFSYFDYPENISKKQQDFMKRYVHLVNKYLG